MAEGQRQDMLERTKRLAKLAAKIETDLIRANANLKWACLAGAIQDIREIGAEAQAQIGKLGG